MRLLTFFLLLILTSCQRETVTHFDGSVMTMRYHVITGYAADKDALQFAIDEVFLQTNQIFNRFNPNSEISRLNRLKQNEKVQISDEMKTILELTDRLNLLTKGHFDPTIHTVQQIWRDHLQQKKWPSEDLLKPINEAVGWHHIHLEGHTFWKDRSATTLDLSGIAKGHAIDLLIKRLNEMGFQDVYVEWGGEIAVSGRHPSGRDWSVAITPPKDPHNPIEILALNNQAIATSGDYLQYWVVEDETYCHIFDPITKTPLKKEAGGLTSATVVAPTCAEADALATASMLIEDREDWAGQVRDKNPAYSFWFFNH